MAEDFEIKDNVLVKYNGSEESVAIPAGVAEIGKAAFANCKTLVSVQIPEGVQKIADFAFQSCTALKSVKIPNSVKEIGSYAFVSCAIPADFSQEVAGVRFMNSLCIKDTTILYCTNRSAETLDIPDFVTSVRSEESFKDCYKLDPEIFAKICHLLNDGPTIQANEDEMFDMFE